jgi:hypothetical protein
MGESVQYHPGVCAMMQSAIVAMRGGLPDLTGTPNRYGVMVWYDGGNAVAANCDAAHMRKVQAKRAADAQRTDDGAPIKHPIWC